MRKYNSLFERQETNFNCKFLVISMLLDPVPHSNRDPDPGQPNESASGSTTRVLLTMVINMLLCLLEKLLMFLKRK